MNRYRELRALRIFLGIIFSVILIKAESQLLTITVSSQGIEFPFTFSHWIIGGYGDTVYWTSSQPSEQYSIGRLSLNDNRYMPLALEKVKLNSVVDQDNPLYNTSPYLMELARAHEQLWVVPTNTSQELYLIDRQVDAKGGAVYKSLPLKDSEGNDISRIESLACASETIAFAAVCGAQAKKFGDKGSGIAIVAIYDSKKGEENTVYRHVAQMPQEELSADKEKIQTVRAFPLDSNHHSISLHPNSQLYGCKLHWHDGLRTLFIGLDVQAGDGNAQVLLVAHSSPNEGLKIEPFIPFEVLAQCDGSQVGCVAAGQRSQVDNMQSMYTSTHLNYLIVQMNEKSDEVQKQSVYALPLANLRTLQGSVLHEDEDIHGQLASINESVENIFSEKTQHHFLGRALRSPVQSLEQVPSKNDPAVLVGTSALEGTITQLLVQGDAVYALVSYSEIPQAKGLFVSRPFYDAQGTIKGWTSWSRASDSECKHVALNTRSMGMSSAREQEKGMILTTTTWNEGKEEGHKWLSDAVQNYLCTHSESTGVRAFTEVSDRQGENALIIIGNKKIVCAHISSKTFAIIDNPLLQAIAPLVDVQGYWDDSQCHLYVSGTHGAVDISSSNLVALCKKEESATVTSIVECNNVRKVIQDRSFVYILTDSFLERRERASLQDKGIVLAHIRSLSGKKHAVFKDFFVSDGCAILATTDGVFRIGNGSRVDIAANEKEAFWTVIPTSLHKREIIRALIPLSSTLYPQDMCRTPQGGQITLVCASDNQKRTVLYRYSISSTLNSYMNSTTIQPLADYIKNTPWSENNRIYFKHFSFPSSFIYEEGAWIVAAAKNADYTMSLVNNIYKLKIESPEKIHYINGLLRTKSSGVQIIGGDFGLRINE